MECNQFNWSCNVPHSLCPEIFSNISDLWVRHHRRVLKSGCVKPFIIKNQVIRVDKEKGSNFATIHNCT